MKKHRFQKFPFVKPTATYGQLAIVITACNGLDFLIPEFQKTSSGYTMICGVKIICARETAHRQTTAVIINSAIF